MLTNTVDDVFPVLTKTDFINNHDKIKSKEVFDKPLHISSTSGSTGTPFSVEQDFTKRMRNIADLKVYGEYALYPSHEKMLQLRAYNGKILDRTIDERENIWRWDISNLSESNIDKLIDFIIRYKPKCIFGYVSALSVISRYIISKKIVLNFTPVSVLVGAEILTDEIAKEIKEAFNCPVFDRYSNMEMGIYAQREHGKTDFRINKASYYFEILKLESDNWAEVGEVGRIVVTDLYNHAFPMIRYDTGDLGTYDILNNDVVLKSVYGRSVDSIYDANGELLNPHAITNGMWGIDGINQWQFIQKSSDSYLIKLNVSAEKYDQLELEQRLKMILGKKAKIYFEYVVEIPVTCASKRKYIVNETKKG